MEQGKSYTKVIDYIKDQIRAGELKIGEKLPSERELSSILGVSRNSVREAIRTLDFMGIISSQHGVGNYLTGNFENNLVESLSMLFLLDQISYKEISQLRLGLETQALLLAIDEATEEELKEIERISLELEHGAEEDNVILDKKLHYNIAKASRNKLIFDILQALSETMDRFIADLRKEIFSSEESRNELIKAHNDIVKSLINRDKVLAYQAINKHFELVNEKLK
ncbi:FadR/GntR family transcriptional regulator [Clostridium isatidis]|uniref:GntR family transcriptional regulator n=1 Tax=Clostridium isatidis TaxID=182773 RepID=A0A343JEK5_9CLOT|nr:FadR/GntR family transcriptional regulator [Clostridium isatidis]ASW43963.1 GntR family transcriptional regulator [Clostridium isatidis]